MILMMKFTQASAARGRRMRGRVCARNSGCPSSATSEARAQSAVSGVPNAMQGFSQNRDQPIQIEAASLEMRDKKKEATFSGNVKVVQGDTTMTSKSLVVFYEQSGGGADDTRTGTHQGSEGGAGAERADAGRDPRPRRQFESSAGSKPRAASSSRKRTRS